MYCDLENINRIFVKKFKQSEYDNRVKLINILFDDPMFTNLIDGHEFKVNAFPLNSYMVNGITVNWDKEGILKINFKVINKSGDFSIIKGTLKTILKVLYGTNNDVSFKLQEALFSECV